MLGKIWNYFAPSSGTPSTQETKDNSNPFLLGSLYVKKIGTQIQQLSEEAKLTISILDKNTYDYILKIENKSEVADSQWTNLQFVINSDLHLRTFHNSEGIHCIMWQKGINFYILEQCLDKEVNDNEPIFYDNLKILVTSNAFQIPAEQAEKEETKENCITFHGTIDNISEYLDKNYSFLTKKDNDIENITEKLDKINISKSFEFIDLNEFKLKFPVFNEIFGIEGYVYKYDKVSDKYNPMENNTDSIICQKLNIIDIGNHNFILCIINSESLPKVICFTTVDSKSSIVFNKKLESVSFLSNHGPNNTKMISTAYLFKFKNPEDEDNIYELKRSVTSCTYQNLNQCSYENLNKDIKLMIQGIGMYAEDNDEEAENNNNNIESNIINNNLIKTNNIINISDNNKLVAQAFNFDRNFVITEDNTIKIFKTNTEDNKPEEYCTISANKINESFDQLNQKNNNSLANPNFKISKVKMFDKDNQMLFLNSYNPGSIWQYDLGKETIIEEWQSENETTKFIDMCTKKKYDQMQEAEDILAITPNCMLNMDGRVNRRNKVVDRKNYTTAPDFRSFTTDALGEIATGSGNGDIRLFSEFGRNAKSLLPCYGDPIRYIDTTNDGTYILATCDKYLLVINTASNDGVNTGFKSTIEKYGEKNMPKTLKISPENLVKYGLSQDSFTKATFNKSKDNNKENLITTSLGEYIITWDFESVKKGILDNYMMEKVGDVVIRNTSIYNQNKLFFVTKHNVGLK